MENSSPQFHKQVLANEKMKERFEFILNSSNEDVKVKKELRSLLSIWSVKYKGKKPTTSSTSTPLPKKMNNNDPPFDFEKSKPIIMQEIALANQNSNQLMNALRRSQGHKDLEDYRDRCEESKEKMVHYARLVEDEEWIGTLLATNEELIKSLEMYDIMLAQTIRVPQLQFPEFNTDYKEDPFADPSTPVEERSLS
ncbi:unnamed protein product [Rhizopus stolonifer]